MATRAGERGTRGRAVQSLNAWTSSIGGSLISPHLHVLLYRSSDRLSWIPKHGIRQKQSESRIPLGQLHGFSPFEHAEWQTTLTRLHPVLVTILVKDSQRVPVWKSPAAWLVNLNISLAQVAVALGSLQCNASLCILCLFLLLLLLSNTSSEDVSMLIKSR
ncbi:hypothetical protein DFJ58DRAFT_463910 [Suillus subalutaceus]|uniref:uncharacterized protein n=1 Tax=Suillus subalutaceus TaxID=48586 RepID=UPI001B886BD1|nr:uncharacterized protein DFJ58DRAFT_463910 [Suillus subalutaceus]KAG1848732.1 hypothetical protein DFJ58DRAFT_463910 [Suillus subalutaceus]